MFLPFCLPEFLRHLRVAEFVGVEIDDVNTHAVFYFTVSQIVQAQQGPGFFALLHWNVFSILFPMLVIFFVSSLAETQRPPFDLLEAESELVAGFFVEYSSGPFLLFFLAEYMNVIMLCAMMSILFLGGWLSPINAWPFNIPVLGMVLVDHRSRRRRHGCLVVEQLRSG